MIRWIVTAWIVAAAVTAVEAAETLVVSEGSAWSYEDSGTDLGTAWREPEFDHSGWDFGLAPLGYGQNFIQTMTSFGLDPLNKPITTYFRHEFSMVSDPSLVGRLVLDVNYDDGLVVYLNGTELLRRALPDTNIVFDTRAALHEGGELERYIVEPPDSLLVMGTNFFAVEVHQDHPTSSDLVFDMAFSTSDDPSPLIRGPYLQSATPNSIVVRWRTVAPSSSWVHTGSSPDVLVAVEGDALLTTEHEVLVTGLSPAVQYFYGVGTADSVLAGADSLHAFTTPPLAETATPFRAWILGDSGLPGQNQIDVRDAYLEYAESQPADLWILLGDNAYSLGTDVQYQEALFDAFPSMLPSTPLWSTRGNHDLFHSGPYDDYYDIFTLPTGGQSGGIASGTEAYYSFDWANVHFICLDSFGTDWSTPPPMLAWLVDDLAATDQDWIIAFWHHPPYSKGGHDSDTESLLVKMRENALPILEAGDVDLVLTGHSHSYERSFLLTGHHDISDSLQAAMIVDGGDGRRGGDGAYVKPMLSPDHEGAVYVVVGSSSRLTDGPLNHPVMVESLKTLGSMILDVDGLELRGTFLNSTRGVKDSFTMVKGAPTAATPATADVALRAGPNPFAARSRVQFTLPLGGRARLEIYDAAGRHVDTPLDASLPAGSHAVWWDGRDHRGRGVGAGLYLTRLVLDGRSLDTGKLLLVR